VMVLLCDITILVNLNPFVRMDGYWIISDLLEMPHLMEVNKATTAVLLSCIIYRRKLALPEVPTTFRWSRQCYYIYYSLFAVVMIYVVWLAAVRVLPHLSHQYPGLLIDTARTLRHSPWSLRCIKLLFGSCVATVSLVSLAVLALRVVRSFASMLANIRAAGAEVAVDRIRIATGKSSSCVTTY
jgi:putative peptide zinc metalloprotease protein